jgi:BirA family transcriptional regulator, biotin operon repressor / biotin---[acetyl-CoA-carboxylase] ligase
MPIIKLDAIDSTNDFLKDLIKNQAVENFTVVVTNSQTNGRGQMGTKWSSESGKNLIMSILIKDLGLKIDNVFVLNAMISVAVIEALFPFYIRNLSVKWPNDIMSDNKKIAGILIENNIKPDNSVVSVVGIGLNINQSYFENLPSASSLFLQTGKMFSIDEILEQILTKIQFFCQLILEKRHNELWQLYHHYLFKKSVPMAFEDNLGNRFMGIIELVNQQGFLQIKLENDVVKLFSIKEIKMLY